MWIFKNLENALAVGHNASKNMQQMAFDAYFDPTNTEFKSHFPWFFISDVRNMLDGRPMADGVRYAFLLTFHFWEAREIAFACMLMQWVLV